MKFLNQIRATIKHNSLLGFGDRIVVGVSGGADSVALLFALNYLKKEFGLYLHIVHLDHMMRKDSFRDSLFVEKLAKTLNITITIEKINVLKLAKGGSLEEIARNARFDFLFKIAKTYRCNKIALGHNRDDQAETVLMRILRGTGLYGLQAILPIRRIKNYIIIRPLLEVDRKSIENFLKLQKIRPRVDRTNKSLKFSRNRLRHKLIPLLEKEYNPNIKQVLSTLASGVSLDYAFLEKISQEAFLKCSKINKSKSTQIIIDLSKFKKFDLALQRMVFRLAINRLKGDLRRLTFKHILELEALVDDRPTNSVVNLPAGISVKKSKTGINIYKN